MEKHNNLMERFNVKESNVFKTCEISVDHCTLIKSMQRELKRAVFNPIFIFFCHFLLINFSVCVFQSYKKILTKVLDRSCKNTPSTIILQNLIHTSWHLEPDKTSRRHNPFPIPSSKFCSETWGNTELWIATKGRSDQKLSCIPYTEKLVLHYLATKLVPPNCLKYFIPRQIGLIAQSLNWLENLTNGAI